MPIDDPRVVRLCNERLRPRAEQIRLLRAQIDDDLLYWQTQIVGEVKLPNDETLVDDHRQAEGISHLKCSELYALQATLAKMQAIFGEVGVDTIVSKFCVRPLD